MNDSIRNFPTELIGKVDPQLYKRLSQIYEMLYSLQQQQQQAPAQVQAAVVTQLQLIGLLGPLGQSLVGISTNPDPLLQNVGTGTGTVTTLTVGNLNPLFNTAVLNPTTAPALSFVALSINANRVYAGPASGAAAAPTFRALVAADFQGAAIVWGTQSFDLDNAAAQAVYTVPTGKSALPLIVVAYAPSVDLSGGTTTFLTFGFDGGATDWSTTNNFSTTGLTAATLYQSQSQEVAAGNGPAVIGTSGQTFKAIVDAAFGSAATVQIATVALVF